MTWVPEVDDHLAALDLVASGKTFVTGDAFSRQVWPLRYIKADQGC